MSSLFELSKDYVAIKNMLLDENIDEQCILDTLEGKDGEIEEKAENYVKIIKEFEMIADRRKEEGKKIIDSAKVFDNKVKTMKKALFNCMKITGKTKITTNLFNIAIVKNGGKQPLKIDGLVPEEYTKTVIENDTDKIREALENGKELKFAHLEERVESLRIK